MNYELAKQLKEAGFPQGELFPLSDKEKSELGEQGFDPDVYFPTLSELIEACGENFERLHKENLVGEEVDLAKDIGGFEWYAYSYQHQYGGDTPEEAVARLYLALNKK